MLTFAVYTGSETLEDLGTVAQAVGAKGTLAFINKNLHTTKLNKSGNRTAVVVVLKNKKGESTLVSCSQTVSSEIRSALDKGVAVGKLLGIIAKLNILEGETGIPYICAPAGENTGLEEFVIESLTKETVGYESFLTF